MTPDAPLVSVLIPSRGRPDALQDTVTSLRGRATDPHRVEIYVAHDPDDRPTGIATSCRDIHVIMTTRRYGPDRLHEYHNLMAARAAGTWLLPWTDRATMCTDGWDKILADLADGVLVADFQAGDLCRGFSAARRDAVTGVGPRGSSCVSPWPDAGPVAPVDIVVDHGHIR